MQDVSTACSIEIEQNVGRQASHAGGRWFDPTLRHSSLVRNSEITSPRLGSLLEPVQIRLTKSRSSDQIGLACRPRDGRRNPAHWSSPTRTGVAVEAGPLGGELVGDESENHLISACRNRRALLFAAAAVVVPLVFIATATRAVADGGVPTEAPAAYDAGGGSSGSGATTGPVDGGMPERRPPVGACGFGRERSDEPAAAVRARHRGVWLHPARPDREGGGQPPTAPAAAGFPGCRYAAPEETRAVAEVCSVTAG